MIIKSNINTIIKDKKNNLKYEIKKEDIKDIPEWVAKDKYFKMLCEDKSILFVSKTDSYTKIGDDTKKVEEEKLQKRIEQEETETTVETKSKKRI